MPLGMLPITLKSLNAFVLSSRHSMQAKQENSLWFLSLTPSYLSDVSNITLSYTFFDIAGTTKASLESQPSMSSSGQLAPSGQAGKAPSAPERRS